MQGNFDGTISDAGNPAWDGSSLAACTEPVVNITSGPSGFTRIRTAVFTFLADRGVGIPKKSGPKRQDDSFDKVSKKSEKWSAEYQ